MAEVPPGRLLEAAGLVLRGHPSMAPLWRLASATLDSGDGARGAETFLRELTEDAVPPAALAEVLPDTVLTISYSSSVARAIELRRPSRTICMRSEPGHEGTRLAALIAPWTRVQVMDDDRALLDVPADAALTGADAVTPEAVINKVKSRSLAEAAGRKGIPCYAVAGRTKLVDRPLSVGGPFEAVPLDLFTGIALPYGLLSPAEASAWARRSRLHPALSPLLEGIART